MRMVSAIFVLGCLALTGCGGGSVAPNTNPLTEEQKAKLRAEDSKIDDEEKSGAGTATKPKGKR